MPRFIVLLTVCAAAACSASAGSRADERVERHAQPADSVPRRHADVDLTGPWATGSTGEPLARRLVLRVQCNYSPPLWALEQRGDTVRAWILPESHAQGIATTQHASTTAGEGWVSGVDLTMSLAGARYALRYDSTSGHLRGTLNGAPFWAVRQDLVRQENCIPVP